MSIVEWVDGYPSEKSLQELKEKLDNCKNFQEYIDIFYSALRENHWGEGYYGVEEVEVRGKVIPVWGYHTGGWSGNEAIIHTLERTLFYGMLLERYDKGGHYYFKLPDSIPVHIRNKHTQHDCHICDIPMVYKSIECINGWGDYSFIHRGVWAYVCSHCGERIFPSNTMEMLEAVAKKLYELPKEYRPKIVVMDEGRIKKCANIAKNP